MADDIIRQAEAHINSSGGNRKGLVIGISALVFVLLFLYFVVWTWGFKRVYVAPGTMLVLTRQVGGEENPDPNTNIVVDKGFKGIEKEVLGEGRHFVTPVIYKCDKAPCVVIPAGKMGMVVSLSGTELGKDEFIAVAGEKGIREQVLPPGRYRLNPRAFEIVLADHIEVPHGFVGCVRQKSARVKGEETLTGEKQGIWKKVLQPGIYYLNPKAFAVEIVEVGFRLETFDGISFPSKDGFPIAVDVSVVWGLTPMNVAHIISKYGNVDDVVEKVIKQQVESICRLEGSKYTAKELLQGETRQKYQDTFTSVLMAEFQEAKLEIQIGLVRGITIPNEISTPLQDEKLAEEEMLTKAEQTLTQTILNELEELRADVVKGTQEIAAETNKIVAEIQAAGEKVVADINAEKGLEVAKIMEEVAKLEAEKERVLGKADADVGKMVKEAESDLFRLNVTALGSSRAYELYVFAQGLPADLKLILRYAGEGTFWTDLPDFMKNIKDLSSFKILKDK